MVGYVILSPEFAFHIWKTQQVILWVRLILNNNVQVRAGAAGRTSRGRDHVSLFTAQLIPRHSQISFCLSKLSFFSTLMAPEDICILFVVGFLAYIITRHTYSPWILQRIQVFT